MSDKIYWRLVGVDDRFHRGSMHQGTMSIHSPGEGAALMEHWIVRTGCL